MGLLEQLALLVQPGLLGLLGLRELLAILVQLGPLGLLGLRELLAILVQLALRGRPALLVQLALRGATGVTGATGATGPTGPIPDDIFASYINTQFPLVRGTQLSFFPDVQDPTGNIVQTSLEQISLAPGYYLISYKISALLSSPNYL